jgi:hypothetical protein
MDEGEVVEEQAHEQVYVFHFGVVEAEPEMVAEVLVKEMQASMLSRLFLMALTHPTLSDHLPVQNGTNLVRMGMHM